MTHLDPGPAVWFAVAIVLVALLVLFYLLARRLPAAPSSRLAAYAIATLALALSPSAVATLANLFAPDDVILVLGAVPRWLPAAATAAAVLVWFFDSSPGLRLRDPSRG